METLALPKSFDEFVDARKAGFLKVKEYVENGGHLVGMFCSYTPLELFDAAGVSVVGLCGTSNEPIADAEKVLPKNLCPLIKSSYGFAYTEKCPYDRLTGASDYLSGYLNGIMDAQQKLYGCYFLEDVLSSSVIEEFRSHLPGFYTPTEKAIRDDRMAMARLYLAPKISVSERRRTMTVLGERFPVDLYTASDTAGLPVQNRGLAKTLTEMPLIFHNSKINLNITSKAIREGLPLRIFDILGCGGFLLTNYQTELPSCFTIGSDLECYGSEEELLEKTEYYLTHEKDREEIAHNGYETVKQYHNYPKRLLEMLTLAFRIPASGH